MQLLGEKKVNYVCVSDRFENQLIRIVLHKPTLFVQVTLEEGIRNVFRLVQLICDFSVVMCNLLQRNLQQVKFVRAFLVVLPWQRLPETVNYSKGLN